MLYSLKSNNLIRLKIIQSKTDFRKLQTIQRTPEEHVGSHISETGTIVAFPPTLALLVPSKRKIYNIRPLNITDIAQFFGIN